MGKGHGRAEAFLGGRAEPDPPRANPERVALRGKHTESWLARKSFAEGCAPRVREDMSVECRGHSLANPTGQGPPMRLSKSRWPTGGNARVGQGVSWRSCRARPSEGAPAQTDFA
jgi:hypothetical protein